MFADSLSLVLAASVGGPVLLVLVTGTLGLLVPRGSGQHASAGAGALTVAQLVATCPAWPVDDPDDSSGFASPAVAADRVDVVSVFGRGIHLSPDFPVPEPRMVAVGRHHLREPDYRG